MLDPSNYNHLTLDIYDKNPMDIQYVLYEHNSECDSPSEDIYETNFQMEYLLLLQFHQKASLLLSDGWHFVILPFVS